VIEVGRQQLDLRLAALALRDIPNHGQHPAPRIDPIGSQQDIDRELGSIVALCPKVKVSAGAEKAVDQSHQ
jgi:hypothetical protein